MTYYLIQQTIIFGDSANQSITSNDTNLTISTSADIVLTLILTLYLDADSADVIFKDDGTEIIDLQTHHLTL